MGSVVDHPAAALMREVETERAIADTAQAQALMDKICQAISDYWAYLYDQGLIYDYERHLVRAAALHVVYDGLIYDFVLKDGAIDRRYNGGKDPDPERRLNPTWSPLGKNRGSER